MSWLIIAVSILILLFGYVLLFGAPYLPTLRKQTETALDMLDLKPGETLLELGSGDGRVLKSAASRGLNAVGYELNPVLVIISKLHTWRYRKQVRVVWANYWQKDWPPAHGIFTFLLDKYMKKLDTKITQTYAGKNIKLVSYAFQIPNKKVMTSKDALYLYIYKP